MSMDPVPAEQSLPTRHRPRSTQSPSPHEPGNALSVTEVCVLHLVPQRFPPMAEAWVRMLKQLSKAILRVSFKHAVPSADLSPPFVLTVSPEL